jgi:hypothetical protein
MLLPDQGIRPHSEQLDEVVGAQRAQLQELANENRLSIEYSHAGKHATQPSLS